MLSLYAILCSTIIYYTVPHHSIPHHTMPFHTTSYYTIPYHISPHHTILYQKSIQKQYQRLMISWRWYVEWFGENRLAEVWAKDEGWILRSSANSSKNCPTAWCPAESLKHFKPCKQLLLLTTSHGVDPASVRMFCMQATESSSN